MYNYICNIVTYREMYPCIHVSMYPIVKLLHREHVLMCQQLFVSMYLVSMYLF